MPDDGIVGLIVPWFGHLERMASIGCPKNLHPRIGRRDEGEDTGMEGKRM